MNSDRLIREKIKLEFKKAFDYIVGKVEEELVKQNYTKQKVVAENDNELVSLFTSATLAYSVVYYKDNGTDGAPFLHNDR